MTSSIGQVAILVAVLPCVGETGLHLRCWLPVPLAHHALHCRSPRGQLARLELAVSVGIESGNDDSGVSGGETGEREAELVIVESTVLVLVDDRPVLLGKLVQETLMILLHAHPLASTLAAIGQLGSGQSGVAIGIAVVPQWFIL